MGTIKKIIPENIIVHGQYVTIPEKVFTSMIKTINEQTLVINELVVENSKNTKDVSQLKTSVQHLAQALKTIMEE